MESASFEDAIRNAVSLGGDSDTLAAITGSVAEGFYGVSDAVSSQAFAYLKGELASTVVNFRERLKNKRL